jgi:FkbM family methyltransferase
MPDIELTCVPNEAAPPRSTGLDATHLERALEVVRHVSSAVDNGRTWNAIHAALTAVPSSSGVDTRLARLERDLMRVMSIVANPAPRATYLGNGLVFLPTAHGLPLIGFADDLQLTPSLLQRRTWDEATTQVLNRIIRPGDRVLDIGANIGYFTTYAIALAGGMGHVHAFEPNPRTHGVLARNVRLNNFSHACTLHQVALGDRADEVTLHTFRNNQGGSTLSTLPDRLLDEWHEHPVDHPVRMTTLDDVFGESAETFACIKMDAEGSEALIWAGGRRFFRERVTDRTVVLLEWNPPALRGAGADLGGLMETFGSHGFLVWRRTDQHSVTPVTDVRQLDDWCNSELVLARDPARVAEISG